MSRRSWANRSKQERPPAHHQLSHPAASAARKSDFFDSTDPSRTLACGGGRFGGLLFSFARLTQPPHYLLGRSLHQPIRMPSEAPLSRHFLSTLCVAARFRGEAPPRPLPLRQVSPCQAGNSRTGGLFPDHGAFRIRERNSFLVVRKKQNDFVAEPDPWEERKRNSRASLDVNTAQNQFRRHPAVSALVHWGAQLSCAQ